MHTLKPILLLFLLYPFLSHAQVSESDSLALVALYNATDGDNWTDNTGWLDTAVGGWYGVEIDSGRVTEINMYNNNLVGMLPPELGDLSGLHRLDLSNNGFTGFLIPEIRFCDSLKWLRVSTNQFEGPLPEGLGMLSALEYIDIHVNAFTSIPDDLQECTRLRTFIAYQNNFEGTFPEVFLGMKQMERLELSDCGISGEIPPEINTMTNLRKLDLGRNNLSGEMPKVDSLVNLSTFHVWDNDLDGVVDEWLGSHQFMYYSILAGNNFTGKFASDHFNPQYLTFLNLENNNFDSLGDFSAYIDSNVIRRLSVHGNKLPFEDLEPNVGVQDFRYAPQQRLLEEERDTVITGESRAIDSGTRGANTSYTWYKDGEVIESETGPVLEIDSFYAELAGEYYSEATNTLLPDLTLRRSTVTLVEGTSTSARYARRTDKLIVMPNPSRGVVNLQNVQGQGRLILYDMTGRVLCDRQVAGREQIALPHQAAGTLLLRFVQGEKEWVGKVVVID